MKRFPLCIIAVLLFFNMGVMCSASSMPYIGNKTTKVYHIAECTWGKRIGLNNRVYFISRERAESSGYRRCHYCGDGIVEPGHGGGSGSGLDSNSDSSLSPGSSEIGASMQAGTSEVGEVFDVWTVLSFCFYAALLGLLMWEFFGTHGRKLKHKQKSTTYVTHRVQLLPKRQPPDKPKDEVSVSASLIAAAAYENTTLYLRFTDGNVHAYQNVPVELYKGLVRAQSPGKYFHEHIDKIYPYYISDRH